MEGKKVGMSLGTAICIFIILLLIAVIIGMYLYYNKDNNVQIANVNANEISANTIENKIYDAPDKSSEWESAIAGQYAWRPIRAEEEGKEIPLSSIWGTGVQYGGYLMIKPDKTYTEYIGILPDTNAIKDTLEGTYAFDKTDKDTIIFTSNSGDIKKATVIINENGSVILKKQELDGNTYVCFTSYITKHDHEYEELTDALKDTDKFCLIDYEENSDGTCTLYGAIYSQGVVDQYSAVLSNVYKKITLPVNTPLENVLEEDAKKTVDGLIDYVAAFDTIDLTINNNSAFLLDFDFSNGKCMSVSIGGLPI